MSLYFDAASILSSSSIASGSLRSRVYNSSATDLKSKPAHIYALVSECAKYDIFLKEVIDNAGILEYEPKLTPVLALLLTHDHFFAKGGIATSPAHPLRQALERHKARLQAEFTKCRLKRKCASIEALKKNLTAEKISKGYTDNSAQPHPRWVRINRIKTTLEEQLSSTFAGYQAKKSLSEIVLAGPRDKFYYVDTHIPDLIALPPDCNIVQSKAYIDGEIILQDKASCFPAYMLIEGTSDRVDDVGDVVDGCAAPGNKTTHVAAILAPRSSSQYGTVQRKIFACERDGLRSKTLANMTTKAGTKNVQVLAKQDFLALDPNDERFAHVTHLLLDPSCSGSGIIGRADVPMLQLPTDPRKPGAEQGNTAPSKKRKRRDQTNEATTENMVVANVSEETEAVEETRDGVVDQSRLERLSNLQSKIVEHALSFPNAVKVSYSTCSIHVQENEQVVARILNSNIARKRSWRLLKREEQVEGMRQWKHRGVQRVADDEIQDPAYTEKHPELSATDLEACIRCNPKNGEGTMGFFVCCFTREIGHDKIGATLTENNGQDIEWDGFDDGNQQ